MPNQLLALKHLLEERLVYLITERRRALIQLPLKERRII
jgi:hypothetical protein